MELSPKLTHILGHKMNKKKKKSVCLVYINTLGSIPALHRQQWWHVPVTPGQSSRSWDSQPHTECRLSSLEAILCYMRHRLEEKKIFAKRKALAIWEKMLVPHRIWKEIILASTCVCVNIPSFSSRLWETHLFSSSAYSPDLEGFLSHNRGSPNKYLLIE